MDDEVWVERDDRVYQREEAEPAPPEKMGYEGKAAQAQASLGDDLWEMQTAASKIAEFTAGRSLADYEQSDVLQAVVQSMLALMAAALGRLAQQSAELGARLASPELTALTDRLEAEKALVPGPEVWRFVQDALPDLLARTRTELEAWHGA